MIYAIVSIEKISKCLYCSAHNCAYCNAYGKTENIVKIVSAASSYTQILSKFRNLDKKKNFKYHIHRIEAIEKAENEVEQNYIYAIWEVVYLLNDETLQKKSVVDNEIIDYNSSLHHIQIVHKLMLDGKIRIHSHLKAASFNYFHMWKILRISEELPTFLP